jgi:hypothetical protein
MDAKTACLCFSPPNRVILVQKSVLKKLSEVVEKAMLYRLLGDSYADATWTMPKLHSEIETLFLAEQMMPSSERALFLVRATWV